MIGFLTFLFWANLVLAVVQGLLFAWTGDTSILMYIGLNVLGAASVHLALKTL